MKIRFAYLVIIHLLLVIAVALLAARWLLPQHAGHHVSFVTKRGPQTALMSQVDGTAEDWLRAEVFHWLLIDGRPVVEVGESAQGVAYIRVEPEYSGSHWLFTYAHQVLGLGVDNGVMIAPNDTDDEIIDPDVGRARAYTYFDRDADGLPEMRMTLALPIDPDDRAVRWKLLDRPWEVWPWPNEEMELAPN